MTFVRVGPKQWITRKLQSIVTLYHNEHKIATIPASMNLAENYCNITTYNFNWKFFCNVVDARKPVSITVLVIVNMNDNEKSRFSLLLGINRVL